MIFIKTLIFFIIELCVVNVTNFSLLVFVQMCVSMSLILSFFLISSLFLSPLFFFVFSSLLYSTLLFFSLPSLLCFPHPHPQGLFPTSPQPQRPWEQGCVSFFSVPLPLPLPLEIGIVPYSAVKHSVGTVSSRGINLM